MFEARPCHQFDGMGEGEESERESDRKTEREGVKKIGDSKADFPPKGI